MTDFIQEDIESFINEALDRHKDDAFIQITPEQLRRYGESKVAGEWEACQIDILEHIIETETDGSTYDQASARTAPA